MICKIYFDGIFIFHLKPPKKLLKTSTSSLQQENKLKKSKKVLNSEMKYLNSKIDKRGKPAGKRKITVTVY